MKVCPYCDTIVKVNYNFCINCGKKIIETKEVKVCPFCRAVVKDDYNFCICCGNKLNQSPDYNKSTDKITIDYINKCTPTELLSIYSLNERDVELILSLRKKGIIFESFSDLQKKLKMTSDKVVALKNENIFAADKTSEEQNKNKSSYRLNLININTADIETLKTLPYLTTNRINTLFELREHEIFITSFDDLRIKLNLKQYELDQIKKNIIIKMPKPEKFKKIDLNKANMFDLTKVGFSDEIISRIILNRGNGVFISSFENLKSEYSLTDAQISQIKEVSIITTIESSTSNKSELNMDKKLNKDKQQTVPQEKLNKNKQISQEEKSNTNNSNEDKNEDKIDLNKASLDQLREIPSINLIKAKKIIELRKENNYITSYEDLQEKINLNSNQINQIKDKTIISEQKIKRNRVVDL